MPGKLAILEERIQRLERDLEKIRPVPDVLRHEQQTFIDAQKLGEVERGRQMEQWEAAFIEQKRAIESQIVRMREFATQYEASQRALKSLEEFQGQILRDQKQVSELQRLAEERQRKELATWLAENEQRWKKELLRWEYATQEQQKATARSSTASRRSKE